ncbi:mitotic spindle assembly checkpoint protein MAD1 [Capronia coronata CBS 617.96]|uniref:Spindle assembly checkpoint component MAD1 n=1 Tax=Capronia coronata CBS 617.96 TaxID=1182541 RepID=W9YFH5_9EURO|nr:mitotic spindle assembly checkpoint protein MAD1 [Capronia coronata CBS 617.96]EXJ88001.1 mitotic spindle assembly checkpoint protein MAD1 [Capronia coronata CBS 617.96]
MSSPASKRMRLSTSRSSLSSRKSLQGGQSSLPRPASAAGQSRHTSTQPTYDFITGAADASPAQPLRQSRLRQPSVSRQDHAHDENLRARINSLEYELKNLQQERGLLTLQHDKELREQQAKAEADFKKYQAAESAAQKATQRQEALARELREAQDQAINEKAALERNLRDLQDQNSTLKEDAEDAQARLADQERQYKYQINDVEAKRVALQETVDDLKRELEEVTQHFDSIQARLSQRDNQVDSLEAEVAALKSHSSDTEALNVLQNQLSEQVAHIRRLESTNREQVGELRRLREAHRSVQIVEEQKHGLEIELQVLKDVERQLGEAQIQKEILEDEKRTWTTLLESNGDENDLKSPEAVVKALIQQRIEYASVMDRLGMVESDLAEKDEIIKALEGDKASLRTELDKLKSTQAVPVDAVPDNKAYKRLERQRVLAVKEVEYLRAQLKTFDTEETVMMDNQNFDTQRSEQIKQLEALVDQYKSEVQTLHSDLSKLESAPPAVSAPQSEPRGIKRSAESQEADEESNSQLGALLRKNKNLQIALQKTAQQSQMLATDLQASKAQLKALRESAKTRVLQLRDNPTANAEAIKLSTLRTLKQENAELLAQLCGEGLQDVKMVPTSTVDALKLDLKDMEMVVAEKEKRMRRQREIWTQKAAEFRDVIASVLGYKVNFLPNGKAKVSSMYYGRPHNADEDSDDEDEDEDYIVFDGDNGTMKISGGPESAFGEEIRELVNFWVKEKKQIPCFLAAMTLEFYEKFASGSRLEDQ